MNDNHAVRSMLVDKSTGRYVKVVDERDLSDFLPLIIERANDRTSIVVFDFASIIQYFHTDLGARLACREHKELVVKRNTVFNIWRRLKTITNEIFLCQISAQVVRDSEELLNWIYTRLPELKDSYYRSYSTSNQRSQFNEKKEATLRLSDEIEVFIETLLCNIYATAKVDIKSFKSDIVITEHCKFIQKLVFEALCSELNYYKGRFNRKSLIYQICMESSGINAEALIYLLDPSMTVASIKQFIANNAITEDCWEDHECVRKYSVSWPKADENSLTRVKVLSKLLEKINLMLGLIEELKNTESSFESDFKSQEEFENNVQKLISYR